MQVGFALLVEHVTESRDGKLSLIGIFDEIQSESVPVLFPRIFAAVRLLARVSEGTEHTVQLVIVDEDGHEVISKSPPFPVRLVPRGPAAPISAEIVAELVGVKFSRFGDYEFNVFVDGESAPLASVPFSVLAIDD